MGDGNQEGRVTEVVVSLGKTVNNPFASYSNLRMDVSVKRQVGPDEYVGGALAEARCLVTDTLEVCRERMLRDEGARWAEAIKTARWQGPLCASCGHTRGVHRGIEDGLQTEGCLVAGCACREFVAPAEAPAGEARDPLQEDQVIPDLPEDVTYVDEDEDDEDSDEEPF